MGRSQRLRLRDVRAVFRLIGEVRELGDAPLAWKQHMTVQLPRLIGAQVGISIEAVVPPGGALTHLGSIDHGWGDFERQLYLRYQNDGEHLGDPAIPPFIRLMKRKSFFTVNRRQRVEDAVWYSSWHVNEIRRAARLDDAICSNARIVLPKAGIHVHVLAMHRPWGERPFEPKQLRLVHLFHDELRRFWQTNPAARESGVFAGLAPRLRQTLTGLLAGASEKEVARRLGLSRNTVHHYVMDLHRHFQVSSRGELLAQCHRLARPTPLRPRLLLETQLDANPLNASPQGNSG
jgi:DNA-binding CsgD family transcriptional regulator